MLQTAQCCSAENGKRGISALLYCNRHLKQKESLNAMPRAEKLHILLTVAVTCLQNLYVETSASEENKRAIGNGKLKSVEVSAQQAEMPF